MDRVTGQYAKVTRTGIRMRLNVVPMRQDETRLSAGFFEALAQQDGTRERLTWRLVIAIVDSVAHTFVLVKDWEGYGGRWRRGTSLIGMLGH